MTTDDLPQCVAKYVRILSIGCWDWIGAIGTGGYGYYRPGYNRSMVAHKYVYQWLVKPVPSGYQLHHICERRHCVNPDHLQLLTLKEHRALHRGDLCKRGHPRVPENTYTRSDGTTICVRCQTIRHAKRSLLKALGE